MSQSLLPSAIGAGGNGEMKIGSNNETRLNRNETRLNRNETRQRPGHRFNSSKLTAGTHTVAERVEGLKGGVREDRDGEVAKIDPFRRRGSCHER